LSKKKLALFTATGCRTCEQSMLDIHYQVNALTRWAEFAFWPYVLGSEWEDLDNQGDIDVGFFCGAIRTAADRQAALKLREKSRILVACGACAAFGGLPGLHNLANPNTASVAAEPGAATGPPVLPSTESRVSSLSQVVKVDYTIPGCPPTQSLLWAAVQALICGPESETTLSFAAARLPEKMAWSVTSGILPPSGSHFAGDKAVCASCSRSKEEKRFATVRRPFETYEETGRCLLEQGLVCLGIATRGLRRHLHGRGAALPGMFRKTRCRV
jgi:F420-non-reducing hydrogenase small subunit